MCNILCVNWYISYAILCRFCAQIKRMRAYQLSAFATDVNAATVLLHLNVHSGGGRRGRLLVFKCKINLQQQATAVCARAQITVIARTTNKWLKVLTQTAAIATIVRKTTTTVATTTITAIKAAISIGINIKLNKRTALNKIINLRNGGSA